MSATGTQHLQRWDDLFEDVLRRPGEVLCFTGQDDQVPGTGVEERLEAGAHVVAGGVGAVVPPESVIGSVGYTAWASRYIYEFNAPRTSLG